MDTVALWIASGTRYIQQAERSAQRVAEVMPELRRVLATDSGVPIPRGIFDKIQVMEQRDKDEFWYLTSCRWFGQAVGALHEPLILYLDTDTYVCEPIYDMLALAARFDVVATHAPGRRTTATVQGVPPAFPEINLGVTVLCNNVRVRRLLELWLEYFEGHTKVYGNNDQGPLRDALWETVPELRLYIAPPEYNLRWHFGGFARYPAKVLHGPAESEAEYQRVQQAVNWTKDLRGWARGTI